VYFEDNKDISGFIKGEEFLHKLNDHRFLKKVLN
jgi:hypothetical protein